MADNSPWYGNQALYPRGAQADQEETFGVKQGKGAQGPEAGEQQESGPHGRCLPQIGLTGAFLSDVQAQGIVPTALRSSWLPAAAQGKSDRVLGGGEGGGGAGFDLS